MMYEKEIIEFLKSNKTKGIAFKFLPEEVQEWIKNHWQDCAILTAGGAWDTTRHYLTNESFGLDSDFDFDDGNRAFYVFCLLASYKLWELVEFEIDDDGFFYPYMGEDDDSSYMWCHYIELMANDNDFIFAGLQYPDAAAWFMGPCIRFEGGSYASTSYHPDSELQPAIPKKIRFWRKK